MASLRRRRPQRKARPSNGNVTRARADRALAQGAGAITTRAIGSGRRARIPRGISTTCWDATSQAHAGLPRAVGPYTVVRTSQLITTKSPLMIFGTYATNNSNSFSEAPSGLYLGTQGGTRNWTNVCAIGASEFLTAVDFASSAIGDGNYSEMHTVPVPGVHANGVFGDNVNTTPTFFTETSNTTCVPSAMSVQVINPEAVQTAAGTAIAAVCPVRLDLQNSQKSWGEVAQELLSYYKPRVLTGGKLALRGVHMQSHPLSMTDVSDFREIWKVDPLITSPSAITWSGLSNEQDIASGTALTNDQKTFRVHLTPEGWAPMVYYSPYNASRTYADRQEMSFLVTTEWRVRFDISNPACASHSMHKPSTDLEWHQMIQKATAALPGVIDIVEKVADSGLRLGAKYAAYTAA